MTAAERADLLFRARWELGRRGRQPWADALARYREATRDAPPWPADEPDAMKVWIAALTREQRHALRLLLAELSGADAEKARGDCRCAACDPTGDRARARDERRRERARRPAREPEAAPTGRHLRLLPGGGEPG